MLRVQIKGTEVQQGGVGGNTMITFESRKQGTLVEKMGNVTYNN